MIFVYVDRSWYCVVNRPGTEERSAAYACQTLWPHADRGVLPPCCRPSESSPPDRTATCPSACRCSSWPVCGREQVDLAVMSEERIPEVKKPFFPFAGLLQVVQYRLMGLQILMMDRRSMNIFFLYTEPFGQYVSAGGVVDGEAMSPIVCAPGN